MVNERGSQGVFLLLLIDQNRGMAMKWWYMWINDQQSVLHKINNVHDVPDYWFYWRLLAIHLCLLPRLLPTTIWICVMGFAFGFSLCAHNQLHLQPWILVRCNFGMDCWLGRACENGVEKGVELLKLISQVHRWCYAYANSHTLDLWHYSCENCRICDSCITACPHFISTFSVFFVRLRCAYI